MPEGPMDASTINAILQRLHDVEETTIKLQLRCEDLEDENLALKQRVEELERQSSDRIKAASQESLVGAGSNNRQDHTGETLFLRSPTKKRKTRESSPQCRVQKVLLTQNLPPQVTTQSKRQCVVGADTGLETELGDSKVLVTAHLAELCEGGKWSDIFKMVVETPELAELSWTLPPKSTTTLLHEAIYSRHDPEARAKVLSTLLSQSPHCAGIPSGCGSLPLHVLLQTGFTIAGKDGLLVEMMCAYPQALLTVAKIKKRLPLHLALTNRLSDEVVVKMIELAPQSTRIPDKNGFLPIHIACGRRCTIMKIRALLRAYPESIKAETPIGETPLEVAIRTATTAKPNHALIEYLQKMEAEERDQGAAKKARLDDDSEDIIV